MTPILAAYLYAEREAPTALLRQVAQQVGACGARVSGVVQQDIVRADRPKCDMYLEEIGSGERIQVSYDRGPMARGCRLDRDGLTRMLHLLQRRLEAGTTDLLIVNKFGRAECEGGGLRDLIGQALGSEIPTLVGVPERNLAAWRDFVGAYGTEISDEAALRRWLAEHFPAL